VWYVVTHPKKPYAQTSFRDPDKAESYRNELKKKHGACDQVIAIPDFTLL